MSRHRSRPSYFPVGIVLKGHGLRGEVAVQPAVDNLEILRGEPTLVATYPSGREQNLVLDQVRIQGSKVLLTFKGIKDRDNADALRGVELSIAREYLPPLGEGEYYLGDLVGYAVVKEDGAEIGLVQQVWDLPANEVLQVADGDREILLPLVDEVVQEIDHTDRRIVITMMEGLLD